MGLLNDKIVQELKQIFAGFSKTVTLKFFSQEFECGVCQDTHSLLTEMQEITDTIKLESYDFVKDKDQVEAFGIDKIPAIVVMDDNDYGIKFYGIPGGYEFSSLVEAIKMVATSKVDLSNETVAFLQNLDTDVHLQVFVTPTCPYCPAAVILAHQMAYASPRIKADMIEATEFPHLVQKYRVMGVPKTLINESEFQEGAASESVILGKIKRALS